MKKIGKIFMKIEELADYLHVSRFAVCWWKQKKGLTFYRLNNGKVYIIIDEKHLPIDPK